MFSLEDALAADLAVSGEKFKVWSFSLLYISLLFALVVSVLCSWTIRQPGCWSRIELSKGN